MTAAVRLQSLNVRQFVPFPYTEIMDHPQGWMPSRWTETSRPDALVVTTGLADGLIEKLLERIADPLLPVLSLVRDDRPWFDASGRDGWSRIETIRERLAELPQAVRFSGDAEDIVLARMFSRDADLTAAYDTVEPTMVGYRVLGRRVPDAVEAAHALHRKGCLTRSFFDRLHVCPTCRSSQLNVREECPACRSSDIVEDSIVHHFRCGFEGAESQFRKGDGILRCPKCSDTLRHIGLDYDKPGSMIVCRSCGGENDQASVGFVCMSCSGHFDTAQMPVRDWFSFRMTPLGRRCLLAEGVSRLAARDGSESFRIILQHALQHRLAFGTPFEVLEVTFDNADAMRLANPRDLELTKALFHDVLRSALRPVDSIGAQGDSILVLLPQAGPDVAAATIAEIHHRAAEVLRHDPGLVLARLPADRVEALAEDRQWIS